MPRQPAFLAAAPLTTPLTARKRRAAGRQRAPLASLARHTTVLVVPTGINAAIGGYAGDALPVARLLSSVTETLITHPNVLNGALLYYPLGNALYVEGHALDAFAASALSLRPLPAPRNKVGLILDRALPPHAATRHRQVADACRATLGLSLGGVAVTDQPVGVHLQLSAGASTGGVANPGALLRAGQYLLERGCDALAVVAEFPEDDHEALADYRGGAGVDAVAGAEAVISHLLTRELHVPVAHAPSLPPLPPDDSVAPKAAAEELGYTFLSCVLVGLSRAPRLGRVGDGGITADDVDVVVVPAGCFGGAAVMSLAEKEHVVIVAVEENVTAMRVPPQAVGIDPARVVTVRNYTEAAGVVAAHRAGIDLAALRGYVPRVDVREMKAAERIPVHVLNGNGRL